MSRIGIAHMYFGHEFVADTDEYCNRISRAAAIGFDLISFAADIPFLSKSDQQRVLERAERENVKINYLGGLPPNGDLCSDSAEDRARGVAHLQRTAKKLAELQEGAELAGAITGVMRQGLAGREKQQCWDHCADSMREAMKVAEDVGVTFSIEVLNRFEHFLINTSDEASRFIDQVGSPNLKMLLDTYHMNIEEDSLSAAIVNGGDKLGLFHIGENNRRPPGYGHIPWDEVVAALKQIDYQGDTVMEPIVRPGGGVGNLLAIWRDLTDGEDLDEAARKGLEFYKAKLETA